GAVLARMGAFGHVIGDFAQVRIEDDGPVEFDGDGRAFDRHFFVIPFANRALITASGGGHAVSGTVRLARIDLLAGGLFVIVIKNLQLTHAHIGRVALAWIANRQTVIATGRELDFKTHYEVGVFLFGVDGAAFLWQTD